MNMNDKDLILLRRYMNGQLNAFEEGDFEWRLLSDPSFAEAAYTEQKLTDLLRENKATAEAAAPPQNSRIFWTAGFGLAASLALAGVSAWLFFTNRALHEQIADLHAPSGNGQLVMLQTMRGSEAVVSVGQNSAAETVVFLIPVAQARGSYVFTLSQGNSEIRLESLQPSAQNWLSVLVPARQLKPGSAAITVAPLAQSGEPERFNIEIR